MSNTKRHQIRIMNEHWEGKYNLVCDVVFEGRINSNVRVEALPPIQEAQVFFPVGTDLPDTHQGMIETAVLANYYGVEIEDNELL